MVTLDYQTNNPRWGIKGIKFQSWESYSLTLGYLSNPCHYDDLEPDSGCANIALRIEGNNEQGAWYEEGRIHYYGRVSALESNLVDLARCSSAGTGRITKRINSNGYMLSLINDYDFVVEKYRGYSTMDVFPAVKEHIKHRLESHLSHQCLPKAQIDRCIDMFNFGYDLRF